MKAKDVLVSICCVSYNHENYIRQCLDGFVMQKTNFAFEILVHEDASTDGTAEIVKSYEENYPNLFRCVYQAENQFLKQNTLVNILFKMAKGKYIALCEGDDYWTDPYKLQKQVDFLEANREYVACFHEVKVLMHNGDFVDDFLTSVPQKHETLEDIAREGNYIHTPSVVFRNVIREYPKEFKYSPVGDYFLYILLAQYGKFKYLNEKMAVYRYGVGVFSQNTSEYKMIKFYSTLFLIWHYYFNINLVISDVVFSRFFEKLNKDLLQDESISQFILKETSYSEVILKINEAIKRYYLKLGEEKENQAVDKFLKKASIFYLLRVVFYKFRKLVFRFK
jgi:glycosyltransferase involved in cell wall biosynthesis